MAELIGQKYIIIDQKGTLSNVTYMEDRADRFVKKGLDRYYRLGFNFRFNGALPRKYGGFEQMTSMITDIGRKLDVTVRFGELAVDFDNQNLFLAQTNPKGRLVVFPDFHEDKQSGLLHMFNEREGIGEFMTSVQHIPDLALDPIELLVHFSYSHPRLETLLGRARMEDEEYYRELRDIVTPVVEFVDPI